MANINRDFLIINDVKKSNVKLDNGSIFFYITDKNTQNIFVNLVIDISKNEKIQKFANIENAEDYTLTMNIVKPDNTYKVIEGKLHDKANAIFEFDLKSDCCDKVGTYYCELLTKCNINSREEITTSNKVTYKVKSSVLNNLDDVITEAPEYPLVVQLFDKLSDIDQYEEDRRAAELARQLAEERRQTEHAGMVSDINGRVEAVNKLIVDTKSDIDAYKEAKNTEINQAIARQDEKINQAIARQDEKINAQDTKIGTLETNDATQDLRLNSLEAKDISHEAKMRDIETKNTEQDRRLDAAENRIGTVEGRLDNIGNDITNTMQPQISSLSTRIDNVEAVNVEQNSRLDAIEIKNQQQDNRLLAIEKHDEKQDIDIKCLFSTVDTIDVTKEGNDITLQNSKLGFAVIDEIDGNTMVNCNKEADKTLVLNGNINTSGYSNITLTDGVDSGLVDVALEGNTMVNVCDQKDPVAITKSYTVETGNHVALQGEYDGKCRPVVTGNTLVNGVIRYGDIEYSTSSNIGAVYGYIPTVKPNTTYTIIYFIKASNNFTVSSVTRLGMFRVDEVFSDGTQNSIYCFIGDLTTEYQKVVKRFTTSNVTDKTLKELDIRLRNAYTDSAYGLESNTLTVKDVLILEGDYTNKPIPEYFEGMKSSFEDKVVTQEMVDTGEELAENLGKYKVEYVITGKNKIPYVEQGDINADDGNNIPGNAISRTGYIPLKAGKTYNFTDLGVTNSDWYAVCLYDKNKNFIKIDYATTYSPTNDMYIRIKKHNPNQEAWTPQVEEGDTVTPYEPYKEYTKTFYLNSPLLEGDTIEESGGNVVHVHRYGKVVLDGSENWELSGYDNNINACAFFRTVNLDYPAFNPTSYVTLINDRLPSYGYANESDITSIQQTFLNIDNRYLKGNIFLSIARNGNADNAINIIKQWLQANPMTVVYQLASPTYEVISQSDTILCDSYVNGHLDFDTAVPVEKVEFKENFNTACKYIYASTEYIIQFESDNNGKIDKLHLAGSNSNTNANVVKGINKFRHTTDSTLGSKSVFITGISFNASNIVVTEATDKDFGYFEGMKSVGECEDLEVVSSNSDSTQSNTQTLTHEPLRAVGNVKDRYVLIDNKWYIERKCGEMVLTGSESYVTLDDNFDTVKWFGFTLNNKTDNLREKSICDKFINSDLWADVELLQDGGNNSVWHSNTFIAVAKSKLPSADVKGFKQWLSKNPTKIVYYLQTPVYEPIDYNPLEVYSDITHISNNSTIPANMVIKNTGYNCMLKPSTTYTVSSNLGLNVVTTPNALTEDCLRFYDSDTSTVTTMKNVLILEGDYTTNGKPMPSHFSGMESAFEQQYDEVVGKYKVKAIVRNEEGTKEHSIEFYINEPLRGVGDVKDKVYSDSDNIVIQRNCGEVVLDGINIKTSSVDTSLTNTVLAAIDVPNLILKPNGKILADKIAYKLGSSDEEHIRLNGGNPAGIGLWVNKNKLSSIDKAGMNTWLQSNPIVAVAELASPTYEVIDYPDAKLLLDIFPNSTLYYENNVPVTSTVRYTYSNPVMEQVNTVSAQVSNLSGNDVVLMSILDEEVNK